MNRNYLIGIIGLVLLAVSLNISLGLFTSEPQINPGISTIYTDQDLTCEWKINETINANVTWYKNNIINTTYTASCTANIKCTTEGAGIISKDYTTKSDIWTCEVTYYNGTEYEMINDSITIQDSVPTLPRVYLANGSEILNNTITAIAEDYTTIFTVNSTDADTDEIKYTLESNTASCSIDSVTGELTCTPSSESHVGIKNLRIKSEDYTTGATRGFINITLNVTQTNDAPYFSPILANQTVIQGNALNYSITGADDESNTPYNFYIVTTLDSLIVEYVSNISARIKFNNSEQDIATFSDRGNHTITVLINDSGSPSLTFNRTFGLEVIPVNQLPDISIYVDNSTSLIQGGPLLVLINATDENNDTLTFYSSNTELYNISYESTDFTDPEGISYANATISIDSLTNDHVLNRNVIITVFDGKENTSQAIFFNITNVNDAPVIHEISRYSVNRLNNSNISNLTAYVGVFFVYRVNATDIDTNTYAGETLTFSSSDNNSFPIDSSTGVISFTPTTEGNYSYIITVTDSGSATFNQTTNISIYPNQNPIFTQENITIQCYEYDEDNYPENCYYNMSANVTDTDIGDYIDEFWTNSTLFTINIDTGIINFTANQSDIGYYPIIFNATDSRGGMNSTMIYLIINNTNNRPIINQTINIPPGRMVIGNIYLISVYAGDNDLQLNNTYENLTFLQNVTGQNPGMFTITKTSTTQAVVTFNPTTTSDSGNYTINITVKDYYNNLSSPKTVNIFIYNVTNPPNITHITPFGTPLLTNTVSTSWAGTSNFTDMKTNITIQENTTYIFNQTAIVDNASYSNFLNYSWKYDGVQVSTSQYYNKYFDFFSSGIHNITFLTVDEFNKSATFTWWINTTNVNRPPILWNPLDNLIGVYAINKSTTETGYMYRFGDPQTYKFYDPDDDLNSTLTIDINETNTLTYAATYCPYANFVFIGTALYVGTISIGKCVVNFTAIDALNSSMNVTSYNVTVNITAVSNDTTPEPVPIRVSGGGGSNTRTITIPLPEEVEKPIPLQILTPKLVTTYKNATIKVPIVLNNTWNDTLQGIRLAAYTNASNVTLYLDKTYFAAIRVGGIEEITLTIGNYKSEGHYEIQLYANVTNPAYKDTATIFVNSADMKSEGEELESMISFAQDLLSGNPECQELTELLNEAKKELSNDNYLGTAKLVDSVINGCKYLVSTNKNIEKPGNSFVKRFEWNTNYNRYLIIIGFFIMFVIAAYYLIKKDSSDKEF